MIVIQMAMRAEATPVIERLGLERAPAFGSFHFEACEGVVDGEDVALAVAGEDPRHRIDAIGTQPATLLAHLAIERWSPRLVVSTGTAGGFGAHGSAVGDVYLSRSPVVFHDRRIPIEAFEAYGVGSYPCIETDVMARELGMKLGVVSTGNALDLPSCDLEAMERSGARIKEMEAAAVAWVCEQHGVDFLAVKTVTDLVDGEHPTEDEFLANLARASDINAAAVARVVTHLAQEPE